jgi:hypothetical protein
MGHEFAHLARRHLHEQSSASLVSAGIVRLTANKGQELVADADGIDIVTALAAHGLHAAQSWAAVEVFFAWCDILDRARLVLLIPQNSDDTHPHPQARIAALRRKLRTEQPGDDAEGVIESASRIQDVLDELWIRVRPAVSHIGREFLSRERDAL